MWGAVTRTYLDHAATHPLLPEVDAEMARWRGIPVNPSSVHAEGRRAADALEEARAHVAALVGRPAAGIVFCSGATEANHQALRGMATLGHRRFAVGGHEHPSVRGALQAASAQLVPMAVGADGAVRIEPGDATAVVCMAANHETGVIQPLADAFRTGLPVHVDATAAVGRVPCALGEAETVAFTAHKLGGPVGIGALSLRGGGPFPALLPGGTTERGRRAGTPDVVGAVGFGTACRLAAQRLAERTGRHAALDRALRAGLLAAGARPVGDWDRTVPGTTCFRIPSILGETVVQALDLAGVAVSSGAACASGSTGPSPVLQAMGIAEARGGVRVSLGQGTGDEDVARLLEALSGFLGRRG